MVEKYVAYVTTNYFKRKSTKDLSYLPTPPPEQDMTQGEFNRFEFRVFFLLD